MTEKTVAPLEVLPDGGMYVSHVVDLAGYKLAIGRRAAGHGEKCHHKSLIYCHDERRVWCSDCDQPVDSFDALVLVARRFQEMVAAAASDRRKAWDALQAVIVRRAAKEMDRTWGHKMAPCCPHCHRGLLPHDFADGVCAAVSQELEVARRKKDLGE